MSDAEVAVVVVNYRTSELTEQCLRSLIPERARLTKLRVIVVDGGSADSSVENLDRLTSDEAFRNWVSFLPLELNGGFGWANNQAILRLSRETRPPEFILLLNPDTLVSEGAVSALVAELESNPSAAVAGSRLLDVDGSVAASAFRFPSAGTEFASASSSAKLPRLLGIRSIVVDSNTSIDVDWVTGASVLFRVQALQQSGLFDDGFFLYFEEVELMHRLHQRGWKVRHVPASEVYHLEGASTGQNAKEERPFAGYWYASRRRYFGLTGGRAVLFSVNCAWLLGRTFGFIKSIFGKRARSRVKLGKLFLPPFGRQDDFRPAVVSWGDTPGKPPAWMSGR